MTMGTTTLTFEDALRIARGCKDYGGGYRGGEHYEAFQHGIETVIRVLSFAKFIGIKDSQIATLYVIGGGEKPTGTSKPKVLNVNDMVRVKLTGRGRDLGKIAYASPVWSQIKEDTEGLSEWKLWQLMQTFGPHMRSSDDPCFEADIEVVE